MAAARCCEPPQAPRSIPYAAPSASRCHPSSRRYRPRPNSLIVWRLKRPMARKPLMHNYIYFETLEVGSDHSRGLPEDFQIEQSASLGMKVVAATAAQLGAQSKSTD
jgi:two-component sensor histidine kinase